MTQEQWLVIGLCVVLILWYAVGAYVNYRRAAVVLDWLKDGLDELGNLSGMGWLTALHSAGRLVIRDAKAPFRMVELLFALEARENLPVWAFRHILGRRDELYLRADLRSLPQSDLEIVRRARPNKSGDWYDIKGYNPKNDEMLARFKAFLALYPDSVLKVSINRKTPNALVRFNLAILRAGTAKAFYSALQGWFG